MEEHQRITIDKLNFNGCLNFLSSFVQDVAKEYCGLYILHIQKPNDKDVNEKYKRIRDFMLSDCFAKLTGLCVDDVVSKLEYKCKGEWGLDYGKVLQNYFTYTSLRRNMD